VAGFYCWALEIRPRSLIYPGSVILVAFFAWELWSWKRLTGHLFDPYGLFLVAATLFNGGQAILEVFHLNENGILGDAFPSETIIDAVFLVVLGLASLHLGALIARNVSISVRVSPNKQSKLSSPEAIRLVGWVLVLVSLPSAVILLNEALNLVLSQGYFALYQKEAATGLDAGPRVLADFIVPAAFFLLVSGKGSRSTIIASGVILLAYSSIQLFLGYRYHGVMPAVAYVWLWHRCIKRIPIVALMGAGAVVLFIIFPLVGMIRNVAGTERASAKFVLDSFATIDNPGIAAISEMGGSMGTVAHTIRLVPNDRGYDLGTSYIYASLTAFPNLFWNVHPTIAHGTASNWLTWLVNPYIASRGGGLGFSFIAEAYLNFGLFGIPFTLALIGLLYGRFIFWADRSSDPAKLATVACFFAFFTFFARGESALLIRPLIWYAVGPYWLVRCLVRILPYWQEKQQKRSRSNLLGQGI
jgi:hypothetical protein